ncbi:MAG: LysR family substrate binding transcriptional regulator [Osedax symbiont Rs2]|nr:MAG: LysR family substrate binding transcriptional regulator [Osedax symbiont Rs2]
MNLQQLSYFIQLADTGNFTRAARKIGIAQPGLSIAIKKLEQQLGLNLINRSDKYDLLTAEGKVLYQSAVQLLANAEQVALQMQELKDLNSGLVRFGVSAMMGSYYFPQVLVAFKQQYPNINVQLYEQGTAALETMLLNGDVDIALIRAEQQSTQLRYVDFIEEPMMVGMPASHELAGCHSMTLATFCQQPLILFREGYFLREAISQYSQRHNLLLDIKMETNLIELQKSLVKNNLGITNCLSGIMKGDPALITLPFSPPIVLKLGLAWKKNHYLSNASKTFMEFIQQHYSSE